MVKIKNQYAESNSAIDKIQALLAKAGADRVMFDYEKGTGLISALTFSLHVNFGPGEVGGRDVWFRLPANIANVAQILYPGGATEAQMKQAYRTGWANIRDWVDAQLALIQTNQVKVEQVFLPYLMVDQQGTTLFDQVKEGQFLLGPGGKHE